MFDKTKLLYNNIILKISDILNLIYKISITYIKLNFNYLIILISVTTTKHTAPQRPVIKQMDIRQQFQHDLWAVDPRRAQPAIA